jgi:RNA-directed DNA polymerase
LKRAGNLLVKIACPDNLRLAFWKASKGKRHAAEIVNYQQRLEANLYAARLQLIEGKITVGNYRYFTIFEPKKRLICASAFSEQVLHHALMNICDPYFEKVQPFHSYASRRGKGTNAALTAAQANGRTFHWFLKLDIKKFFETIHHETLKVQLARLFKEEKLLAIFDTIINSYAATPGRGLPIGNLTSQYFANHFLTGLDYFILQQLQPGAYMRYMDDLVLWGNDKEMLKNSRVQIAEYAANRLQCALKPALLNSCNRGLPFLGFKVYGKGLWLTQRSKQRFIRKITAFDAGYQSGEWSEAVCARRVLPLLAFIAQAQTKGFRKTVFLNMEGSSSIG